MAFSARLSENTVADDDPVVFETVDLNVGEGYDEFSGKTIQIFLIFQLFRSSCIDMMRTNKTKHAHTFRFRL